MFSQPVSHVSGTRIFSRLEKGERPAQSLIYAMRVAVSTDLAMVLPVPTPEGAAEDALRFVNLETYPRVFEDLDLLFPSTMPVPGGIQQQSLGASRNATLEVHSVGAFEASFVPSRADFTRLDERFRLADEILNALPYPDSWGYAVFKLKSEFNEPQQQPRQPGFWKRLFGGQSVAFAPPVLPRSIQPMAFVFETRMANTLFFPTVHVHDGALPKEAQFDHQLYFQAGESAASFVPPEGLDSGLYHIDVSSGAAGTRVRTTLCHGLIEPALPGFRLSLNAIAPNHDITISIPETRNAKTPKR